MSDVERENILESLLGVSPEFIDFLYEKAMSGSKITKSDLFRHDILREYWGQFLDPEFEYRQPEYHEEGFNGLFDDVDDQESILRGNNKKPNQKTNLGQGGMGTRGRSRNPEVEGASNLLNFDDEISQLAPQNSRRTLDRAHSAPPTNRTNSVIVIDLPTDEQSNTINDTDNLRKQLDDLQRKNVDYEKLISDLRTQLQIQQSQSTMPHRVQIEEPINSNSNFQNPLTSTSNSAPIPNIQNTNYSQGSRNPTVNKQLVRSNEVMRQVNAQTQYQPHHGNINAQSQLQPRHGNMNAQTQHQPHHGSMNAQTQLQPHHGNMNAQQPQRQAPPNPLPHPALQHQPQRPQGQGHIPQSQAQMPMTYSQIPMTYNHAPMTYNQMPSKYPSYGHQPSYGHGHGMSKPLDYFGENSHGMYGEMTQGRGPNAFFHNNGVMPQYQEYNNPLMNQGNQQLEYYHGARPYCDHRNNLEMPEFDGNTSFAMFLNRFEDYLVDSFTPPNMKKSKLLSALQKAARKNDKLWALKEMLAQCPTRFLTYEDVVQMVLNLQRHIPTNTAYSKLLKATQKPNESLIDWHGRVQSLFMQALEAKQIRGDSASRQELMITATTQFISNLQDGELRFHLEAQKLQPTTFEALLDWATSMNDSLTTMRLKNANRPALVANIQPEEASIRAAGPVSATPTSNEDKLTTVLEKILALLSRTENQQNYNNSYRGRGRGRGYYNNQGNGRGRGYNNSSDENATQNNAYSESNTNGFNQNNNGNNSNSDVPREQNNNEQTEN